MIALQTQLAKLIARRAVLLYKNGIERENLKGQILFATADAWDTSWLYSYVNRAGKTVWILIFCLKILIQRVNCKNWDGRLKKVIPAFTKRIQENKKKERKSKNHGLIRGLETSKELNFRRKLYPVKREIRRGELIRKNG